MARLRQGTDGGEPYANHAWDRFALPGRRAKPRRATERELLILATHLKASLLAEESEFAAPGLAAAIAEHQALIDNRGQPPPARHANNERPGDRDRRPELSTRDGWAWTRLFRRYDDYTRALERLGEAGGAARPGEPTHA